MLPYFVVLTLVMLLLFIGSNNRFNKLNKLSYYLSGIVLTIFATIRSSDVGTDSNNYVGIFNQYKYKTESLFSRTTSLETGYLILQEIALNISNDYWSLFFITSLVCVFSTYYIIYKLSDNIKISVFIYISLAIYMFAFNGARQALAASIFGIALYYLINKKRLGYFIIILLASFFHNTALIMLPFYYLLRFPFKTRNLILFSIGSFIALYYLSTILSLFDTDIIERYSVYENRNATGGYLLTLFFFIMSAIFISFRKKILKSKLYQYDIYLNMCIFSSIIYLVVSLTGSDVNFLRLSLYFSIGYVLIWPIIFGSVPIFKESITRLSFVIIHLVFFFSYIYKFSNLNPYISNNLI